MTRGEEFTRAVEGALTSLRRLAYGPYARQDISHILDPLGSRLESFLRITVLPMSSQRDKLYHLIAALPSKGLPQPQVDVIGPGRNPGDRYACRLWQGC